MLSSGSEAGGKSQELSLSSRTWKSPGNEFSPESPEGACPAGTLILAIEDSFWTSDFQT